MHRFSTVGSEVTTPSESCRFAELQLTGRWNRIMTLTLARTSDLSLYIAMCPHANLHVRWHRLSAADDHNLYIQGREAALQSPH